MTYTQVLIKHGFKALKKHRDDVVPFALGDDVKNMRYAEIHKWDGFSDVWIVGKDIKDTGTMSYPGGQRFYDSKSLNEYLEKLPPLTPD